MSHVTTRVIDTVHGRPAAGLAVSLRHAGEELATGVTDADGRVEQLGPDHLHAGTYTLLFETGEWFADRGVATYYPEIRVTFGADGTDGDHIELRLSPFGYSTCRGS